MSSTNGSTQQHIASMITDKNLMLYYKGVPHVVANDHPKLEDIKEALRNKDYDRVVALADIALGLKEWAADLEDPAFSIVGGRVTYGRYNFPDAVSRKVIAMLQAGAPPAPLAACLRNLLENPSASALEESLLFFEANGMMIDDEGYVIAYRAVTNDYKDKHTRTFDNSVGVRQEMPRNQVDDRRNVTCSHGFHFAAFEYAKGFLCQGSDRLMAVRINPKDIVSIPSDYNNQKARCCAYEVIAELPLQRALPVAEVYTRDLLTLDQRLFNVMNGLAGSKLNQFDEGVWDSAIADLGIEAFDLESELQQEFDIPALIVTWSMTVAEVRDAVATELQEDNNDDDDDESFDDEEYVEEVTVETPALERTGGRSDSEASRYTLNDVLAELEERILQRSITNAGAFRDALRDAGFDPSDAWVYDAVSAEYPNWL